MTPTLRIAPALAATLLIAAAPPAAADPPPSHPLITRSFEQVRAELDGGRALETVAFMEPHWRLPGNAGYDASIHHVAGILAAAGFVREIDAAPADRLTYRIESRPMRRETWEPIDATLTIVGEDEPLLSFATNRNMIAIRSRSTDGPVEAELIDVGNGAPEFFQTHDVAGKIVLGDGSGDQLARTAVHRHGAVGVLAFQIPDYNRPREHPDSISFTSTGGNEWVIALSHGARSRLRAALADGPVRVRVEVSTKVYQADELTLIAEVRGSARPRERFVFSAHVQEPGANDNASGVATQAEMARVLATLVQDGRADPQRTITFLWGDEISAIARYLNEDVERARGVRWGISLDMVGEDTSKTGGTFLIEKMPDPSAIWTRGDDRHTEWGRGRVRLEDLRPHYFNDFVFARCSDQAAATGWVVRTNPFEGGSDHVPFLRAGKPGLLLWHFTDVYYHTDGDRLDKVSPVTMTNVGTSALVIAMTLASGDDSLARFIMDETARAGMDRLHREFELSAAAIRQGGSLDEQIRILGSWSDWYGAALSSVADLVTSDDLESLSPGIEEAGRPLHAAAEGHVCSLVRLSKECIRKP